MPLITNKKKGIIVPISDDPVSGLKRMVRFSHLEYKHTQPTGSFNKDADVDTTVVVNLEVYLFAKGANVPTGEVDENGFPIEVFDSEAFGQLLQGGNYTAKPKRLIANGETFVNAAGEYVGTLADYQRAEQLFSLYQPVEGEPVLTFEDFLPESLRGIIFFPEGAAFRQKAKNLNVQIDDLVMQYIIKADVAGRFNID